MFKGLVLIVAALGIPDRAAAQQPATEATPPLEGAATPWVTVRLHAGPNLNLMGDWRDGLSALQDRARDSGLQPTGDSCICMSWGAAALAHVTTRVALGAQFEMLRDTRKFSVTDHLQLLDRSASFGFTNETVVRTTQVIAALYPREGSRLHVQLGAGVGSGHTELFAPGTGANGRVRGVLFSTSVGMESRFWYVDAGWRFHRMNVTQLTVYDLEIDEARDLFDSETDVREFVQDRHADFTGAWARIGLAFHFGRR